MRLRLTVQRNSLPTANILWSVPETYSASAYTVSRLLEDVNHVMPLEAGQWGLEHYIVEVGGFECLHFMPVAEALKEDDHVTIRPLMTAEVRARTLTGRNQISEAGQHLVDGIPFGRPYLRHPHRPAVRIPPRKRQRLQDIDSDMHKDNENDHTIQRLLESKPSKSIPAQPQGTFKTVQFQELEQGTSASSEEDDSDFAPEGSSDEDVSMNEDEEDADDDDDGTREESDSQANNQPDSSSASDLSGSDSDSDSDTDSESSDSDSDTDTESSSGSDSDCSSDGDAPPDILSSRDGSKKTATSMTPNRPSHVTPGCGRPKTKARNERRSKSRRLRYLKETGVLHSDANLADLAKHETKDSSDVPEETHPIMPFSKPTGKRKRLEDEDRNFSTMDVNTVALEQRRQLLIAKLDSASDSTSPAIVLDQARKDEQDAKARIPSKGDNKEGEQEVTLPTSTRRMRPDVGAISRILGRQATQPASKKSKTTVSMEESKEPEDSSDPEFWKRRINLSAFECWDEDFELIAPPFPFKQHWDPVSKAMKDKAQKKRQRRGKLEALDEPQPVVEDEEERIFLDYNDSPAGEDMDKEVNAQIEHQILEDSAAGTELDLPNLPEDMNSLPELSGGDIRKGAVIACKFFAVNPITITPEISGYKTAIVEKEGDSGNGAGTIQLRIAQRDLPKRQKKFGSKGERIYDAADGLLMEDDDVDEALWEGHFAELLEAKLLRAG